MVRKNLELLFHRLCRPGRADSSSHSEKKWRTEVRHE